MDLLWKINLYILYMWVVPRVHKTNFSSYALLVVCVCVCVCVCGYQELIIDHVQNLWLIISIMWETRWQHYRLAMEWIEATDWAVAWQ